MTAREWICTNREYHADRDYQGSSMLRTVLNSPAEYYGRYIGKTIQRKETADLLLGNVTHTLALEPDEFCKLYWVRPEGLDGRRKDDKPILAKLAADNLEKTELTPKMHEQAKAMAAAVMENRVLKALLAENQVVKERGIVWCENEVWYKCRPDWFFPRPVMDSDLHVDLKTTDDPSVTHWLDETRYSPMFKWHYDLQVAAHYTAGIEALTGRPCASGIIVVGKDEPYDTQYFNVSAYRQRGELWRQAAIARIAQCTESGEWCTPEQGSVIEMPTPTNQWLFP